MVPLRIAINKDNTQLTQMLIQREASADISNNQHMTATQLIEQLATKNASSYIGIAMFKTKSQIGARANEFLDMIAEVKINQLKQLQSVPDVVPQPLANPNAIAEAIAQNEEGGTNVRKISVPK